MKYARLRLFGVRKKNIRLLEFQAPNFWQITSLSSRVTTPHRSLKCLSEANRCTAQSLFRAPVQPPICKPLAVLPIIPPYLANPLNGLPKQRSA
jgi:hypothetical protein